MMFVQEVRRRFARDKIGLTHEPAQEFDVGRDARHMAIMQRGLQTPQCLSARFAIRDQFCEHRIVVRCDD